MAEALLDTLKEVLSPDMLTSAHLDAWSASMNYVIGQMSDLMINTPTTTQALTDAQEISK